MIDSSKPRVHDIGKGLAFASEAVGLQPENAEYRSTLGVAHFRAGHWDEAIAALKKAGGLGHDENVTGWYHLAMAYWHKGDKEQARQWYDNAVTSMEKNPAKSGELRGCVTRRQP